MFVNAAWLSSITTSFETLTTLILAAVTVRVYPTAGAVPVSKLCTNAARLFLIVVSLRMFANTGRDKNVCKFGSTPSCVKPNPLIVFVPAALLKSSFW